MCAVTVALLLSIRCLTNAVGAVSLMPPMPSLLTKSPTSRLFFKYRRRHRSLLQILPSVSFSAPANLILSSLSIIAVLLLSFHKVHRLLCPSKVSCRCRLQHPSSPKSLFAAVIGLSETLLSSPSGVQACERLRYGSLFRTVGRTKVAADHVQVEFLALCNTLRVVPLPG